jgi:hypothetical protein
LDLLYTAVDRHLDEQLPPLIPTISALGIIADSLQYSHSLDAVSAAQLMPVLQHAVQLDAIAPRGAGKRVMRVGALVRQPAFAQLKPEQLAALLEVVVEADDEYNFDRLTRLYPYSSEERPAFKQLDAATVASLIILAIKVAGRSQQTESEHTILQLLWASHAGQQLKEDGCQLALPVLLAAFRVWPAVNFSVDSVFKYIILNARRSISSAVQLELLTAALQVGNKQAFEYLWKQHATASLTGVALGQLLCIASRSGKRMFSPVRKLLCQHLAWDASCAVTDDKLVAQQLAAV